MKEERIEQDIKPPPSDQKSEIIPGYSSMEQFTKDGFKVLKEGIRHANALPSGREWDFYSISDSFSTIITEEGNNVLRLMNQIMHCNDIDGNIKNRVLDEKVELIVEANDAILEKAANKIDEMNGVRKTVPEAVIIQTVSTQLPINGSWNRVGATTVVNPSGTQAVGKKSIKLITAKNIVRPQKFFKDKIDNRNKQPWYPRIKEKPNSLKPLAIFLEEYEGREEFSHPYECELERFTPTAEQLFEDVPTFPRNINDTPLVEIEKYEQLETLVEKLRGCKEFAVDVEHHNYRSFMGITCLLQISTKDTDYLIDALALRDKLYILNEVFTRNSIVKIFHGAEKDVEWLQRDLSIYVVNMFDTFHAAKTLQYNSLSLAFLMRKFCNVIANKQFQLADWRIRPLPEELKTYAREDTHYLIYIYQMLKRELLQKGNNSDQLLRAVIDHSKQVCQRRYFKPRLDEESHLNIYRKGKKLFDNRQLYALKEIYAWRDNLAREEDESLAYVLPNHMLLQIAESLPREMQGILACCNPIPPLVRSHLLEIHQIILRAREQPLQKAIFKEDTTARGVLMQRSKLNVDSSLHCPHDLTKTTDFRDDLPTLLSDTGMRAEMKLMFDADLLLEKSSCSYSAFTNSKSSFCNRTNFKKIHRFAYLSPYDRYKLVKPFVVDEEQKKAQANAESEAPALNKQEEKTGSERTDQERIASIRDHFLQLSKKFSEELEAQQQIEEEKRKQAEQSLIQMGGSRKRKFRLYNEDDVEANSNLETPRPVIKPLRGFNKKTNRKRKRKFSEMNNHEVEEFPQQPKKKRKQNKQQQIQNQTQPAQNIKMGNKNVKNVPYKQQVNAINQPAPQHQKTNNKNRQNWRKPNNFKKQQFKNQPPPNFVPYDYSSVDFRQFQGGAGSATGAVQIKPSFKGKNRKRMGNKHAKSSTFNAFGSAFGHHNRRNANQ